MGFYPELDGLSLELLIAYFQGPPVLSPQHPARFYEEVARVIALRGDEGRAFLRGTLSSADSWRLPGLFNVLTQYFENDPVVYHHLVAHLRSTDPQIVCAAVDALTHLREGGVVSTIKALGSHDSPQVRAAVLSYMGDVYPEDAFPILVAALADPHPVVRHFAIDELDMLNAVEAIPHLRNLETDPDENVRRAAAAALKNLRGS